MLIATMTRPHCVRLCGQNSSCEVQLGVVSLTEYKQWDAEWKRLLRGGFAFESADFACHPTDSAFAEQMYYQCIAENIGLESVLEEAKSYMQSKKFHPAAIAEELESVKIFWRKHKKPSAKKVWLIYWDNPNDSSPIEERVISIFSIRKSSQEISKFIEEYYKAHSYSLSAKLAFATISSKVDKFRPNKTVETERFSFKLECGNDPKLERRRSTT